MAGVSARDMRAIHRFLDGAYAQVADAPLADAPPDSVHHRGALPRPVLQSIQALIGADLVESFQLWRDVEVDAPYTTDHAERETPGMAEMYERVRGQNPIGAFTRRPANGPVRLSAVMSTRRLRELAWHRHYLRPVGIRDQLKVWLWSSPDSAACLSLDRYESDFADRDVAVLAVLQQHLAAMRESLMSPRRTDTDHASPTGEPLTVREAQVMSWVARGRRNREIAEILFISPATVGKHLENAYAKLGVRSRVEAVAVLRRQPDIHWTDAPVVAP